MKKVRILFVYHVSSIGGGSYCLLNLLKAIDRNVFEPVVLLPQEGPLCKEIVQLKIDIVYFPSLVLYPYNKSLLNYRTLKRLKGVSDCMRGFSEVVKSVCPEIVYFNSMMLFPFLRIAKENGCKTVLHVREHWPLNEHQKQLKKIQNIVYDYTDSLIAINRYSASIFPEKKSTIVYDWIDMDSRRGGITVKELLHNNTKLGKVYLYSGGAQKIKGALEVLKTFSERIKGDNKRLIALGIKTEVERKGFTGKLKGILSKIGIKTYLEKLINVCKKDDRIICVPSIYNITDLMKDVDGFVSFFTIPHANLALAESIIVQLPSIAALTDESMEYSEEGELAELYEFGNINAFTEAWLKLDKDELPFIDDLSKKSNLVAEKFDAKRNSLLFNSVIKEMI